MGWQGSDPSIDGSADLTMPTAPARVSARHRHEGPTCEGCRDIIEGDTFRTIGTAEGGVRIFHNRDCLAAWKAQRELAALRNAARQRRFRAKRRLAEEIVDTFVKIGGDSSQNRLVRQAVLLHV